MRTTTRLAAVRAAAAAGALAVGLAGLGASASAVDNLANIDEGQGLSLTIHKHVKPAPGGKQGHADGTAPAPLSAAVKGVVFTAYKIKNLDLSKQADWERLQTFTKANPNLSASVCEGVAPSLPGGMTLDTDSPLVFEATNDQGEAVKTDMGRGAYLVCETGTNNAVVDGKGVQVVDKALPFIVTLPYPDNNAKQGAKNEWIYNVHSFPKNTVVNKPVKKVKIDPLKNGLGTESQVTYTIDAVVPRVDVNTENFKYFTIYDQLEKGASAVTISKVEIGEAVAGDGSLTGAADVAEANYQKEVVEGTRFARVDFNTVEGLKYLETVPGKTIRVTITAKIDSFGANGVVGNTGNLLVDTETVPHDPANPPTVDTPPTQPGQPPLTPPNGDTPPAVTGDVPPLPTNKVASTWGEVKVKKTDQANQKALKGATFQVYNANTPYAQDCSTVEKDGDPISVNGADTFASGDDGVVPIAGLFIDSAESVDDKEPAMAHDKRCYVLVETAAPAGYVLPTGAAAETKIAVKAGNAADVVNVDQNHFSITNTKTAVPALPLTGASGQVLMMAGGAALVLLSAGTVLVARRREAQD